MKSTLQLILIIFSCIRLSDSYAQEITCQFEYETHYNQCQVCFLKNNTYKLKITSVSDYRFLGSIYLDFKDATQYKSSSMEYRGSCHMGHNIMEYNSPYIEKFNAKYKENQNKNWTFSYSTQIINGQNMPTELKNACSSISGKYDLWKKFAEQEQAKDKMGQEKKALEEKKIEQQRLEVQIPLIKDFKNNVDSLSSIHNYIQITNDLNILVKKIGSNKESLTKELKDYILLTFSDYMNECLNNNDFTNYDSNLKNFILYCPYGDVVEWERKRYIKERDFLISLINLPLSAGDEIYCGKWILTSRFQENEYTMKIELNKDHTFSYSNTALSENYKGYWNIYHPRMELQLVITEYYSYNIGWLEYDPRKSIVPKVYSIEQNKKQNLNLYYSLKQSGGNDVTLFYKGRKIE